MGLRVGCGGVEIGLGRVAEGPGYGVVFIGDAELCQHNACTRGEHHDHGRWRVSWAMGGIMEDRRCRLG